MGKWWLKHRSKRYNSTALCNIFKGLQTNESQYNSIEGKRNSNILVIKRHLLVIGQILILWSGLVLCLQAQGALFSATKHPLPTDQAFVVSTQQNNGRIDLIWNIAEDYYLYQDKLAFFTSNNQSLEQVLLPPAEMKQDPLFGKTMVYYRQLHVSGLLPTSDTVATHLEIHYQGCWSGGVCYPPQTHTMVLQPISLDDSISPRFNKNNDVRQTDWSKTTSTNANWFLNNLENTSMTTLMVIFFLAGLALAFTPCVLPMVPILSSIIVGLHPKPSPLKSFLLSVTYVLFMAATYSIAGLIAGLSGANVQIALQHPAVIGTIAGLFILFAGAMFGWLNVQMPQVVQNKINAIGNNQLGGHYLGVALMGTLSALVVGPCVAAPLAGALLFIAQTGDATTGGLALFVMGLGMGVPLLLVGTSASQWIPKTGPWMHRIKVGFGFLMLLMAVWMTDRVWPEASLTLLAIISLVMALLLALHHRWQPPLESLSAAVIAYTLALFIGLYGIALIVGQLAGTGTLMQPIGNLGVIPTTSESAVPAQKLNIVKVLPQAIEPLLLQAKLNNQPVMLDFYADWCVSCKELDAFVFTDKKVQLALATFKVIKVDVTLNSPSAKQLMQALNLVGPPALVFYSASGKLHEETIIGVPSVDDLISVLRQVQRL